MAKLSTLVAALAILAFTGSAAFAACGPSHTAQSKSLQTAEAPLQTTGTTTTKTEDASK